MDNHRQHKRDRAGCRVATLAAAGVGDVVGACRAHPVPCGRGGGADVAAGVVVMNRDIVVTTPKSQMASAVLEAENAKEQDAGGERFYYFRNLGMHGGANLGKGSRVYYVEDGYLRGFGVIESDKDVLFRDWNECDTTGRQFGKGWYAYTPADSWQWVTPIPYKGFQGWRYAPSEWRELEVIGNWLDPKPMGT
jgi:hypothetical protein